MKNLLLSAAALSLLALTVCGHLATPGPTPPAVVTPEAAGLQAAGLSVTLTDRGLAVSPTPCGWVDVAKLR